MGKLLYLRSAPPVRHRRWRRSPLYWAWRNACEGCAELSRSCYGVSWAPVAWMFLFPPLFVALFGLGCLAVVPLEWPLFESAREIVHEMGEYA